MELKPGRYYYVLQPRDASGHLKVIAQEGGGWYRVMRGGGTVPVYEAHLNLSGLIEVIEMDSEKAKKHMGV